MNLYPWQEKCLEQWLSNQGRGIVQAVTGAGKTRLALAAIEALKRQITGSIKVKIVVPSSSLMQQWNRVLKGNLAAAASIAYPPNRLQQEIGIYGGGHKFSGNRPYMIYVINSARYVLARQILSDLKNKDAVLLIADECHHYTSSQNSLIFEFLPYLKDYPNLYYSLGLSATLPYGSDRDILVSSLGKVIYHYGISQAANERNICPYDVFHISLSFEAEEAGKYQELSERITLLYRRLLQYVPYMKSMNRSEQFELARRLTTGTNSALAETAACYLKLSYKRRSLICLASSRVKCALELVKLLPSQERILIFGERIQQADELYWILQNKFPGKIGRYHSQLGSQANQNNLQRFRDGQIRILITCKALDEGLDVPDASIGIILSGTSMQRQRIQRLGRIIRKKEGKSNASLYYLHVTDTAEERSFLPSGEYRTAELEYLSDRNHFVHPSYDQAASMLLHKLQQNNANTEVLKEYRRCILLGRVRLDWLDTADSIQAKIQVSQSISEKNYWICMMKLKNFFDSYDVQ